jgi:hypothetical protein
MQREQACEQRQRQRVRQQPPRGLLQSQPQLHRVAAKDFRRRREREQNERFQHAPVFITNCAAFRDAI